MRERAGNVKTGTGPRLRVAIAASLTLLATLSAHVVGYGGALDEGADRHLFGRGRLLFLPEAAGFDFAPSSSSLQTRIVALRWSMNAQLDVREEDLPESLAEISRVIGVAATLKLVERFGGARLYVPGPKRLNEDHVIARTIGLAAARAVAKIWGENRPEIPRAVRALRLARDRAVRQESGTLSVPELALKWGLTERQIYDIRSRAR